MPGDMKPDLASLVSSAKACTLCAAHLPLGPRPVFQAHEAARILVVGQAPGRRVHETGIPFNDPSGERLRAWMGVGPEEFYDATKIALLPMGFCYPGTGKSGDLPPRPECAEKWRASFLAALRNIRLTLVIGAYAHAWHLKEDSTLTETVRKWRDFQPHLIPLPHPSPRNNIWLRKNPWFEAEVLPVVRARVRELLL
jgi:uracil-DNA glycosylase